MVNNTGYHYKRHKATLEAKTSIKTAYFLVAILTALLSHWLVCNDFNMKWATSARDTDKAPPGRDRRPSATR